FDAVDCHAVAEAGYLSSGHHLLQAGADDSASAGTGGQEDGHDINGQKPYYVISCDVHGLPPPAAPRNSRCSVRHAGTRRPGPRRAPPSSGSVPQGAPAICAVSVRAVQAGNGLENYNNILFSESRGAPPRRGYCGQWY